MSTTLEWIRDHYDADKDRLISFDEVNGAVKDYFSGEISNEQVGAVRDAYNAQTLLPDYGGSFHTLSNVVSCNIPTGAMLKVNGVEVI